MNLTDFQKLFEGRRAAMDRDARSRKDSTTALFALFDVYENFNDDERAMADEIIARWTLSPNEATRYDAMGLIRRFGITSARSALDELARWLMEQRSPDALYELDKVQRLSDELSGMR